jgi:hypothetical protein
LKNITLRVRTVDFGWLLDLPDDLVPLGHPGYVDLPLTVTNAPEGHEGHGLSGIELVDGGTYLAKYSEVEAQLYLTDLEPVEGN